MEHSFLDKYSERDSFIHHLDPRIKIICFLGFIVLMVLTPIQLSYVWFEYGLIILALLLMSRLPWVFFWRRSLVVFPFVIAIALFIPFFKEGQTAAFLDLGLFKLRLTREGIRLFWNIMLKAWFSVMVIILLSSTTPFTRLLKGLEKLRFPRVMIMILSFMYRYLFLVIDEAQRMKRARNLRYFGGRFFRQLRILGNMVGMLFIRSYERAERVYAAMCTRGFDGTIHTINTLKLRLQDGVFTVLFVVTLFLMAYIK